MYIFVIDSLRLAGAQRCTVELVNQLSLVDDVRLLLYRDDMDLDVSQSVTVDHIRVPGLSKESRWDFIERGMAKIFGRLWGFAMSPIYSKPLRLYLEQFEKRPKVFLVSDSAFFPFRSLDWNGTVAILHSKKSVQYKIKGRFTGKINRWIFERSVMGRELICISNGIKSDVEDNFNKTWSSIKVVYNIVDQVRVKELSVKGVKYDFLPKSYFIYVGRLSEEKRVVDILDAYTKLIEYSPECQDELLIVGDGPFRKSLESKAVSLGVSERVHFLGKLKNPYPLMRRAKALILASDREGLPTVMIEALMLDVPVICSRCFEDLKFILSPKGYQARSYDVGDVVALKERMEVVSPELYIDFNLAKFRPENVARFISSEYS